MVGVADETIRRVIYNAGHVVVAVFQIPRGDEDDPIHALGVHVVQPELAGLLNGVAGRKGVRKAPGLFPLILLEFVHFLQLFPFFRTVLLDIIQLGLAECLILDRKVNMGIDDIEFG